MFPGNIIFINVSLSSRVSRQFIIDNLSLSRSMNFLKWNWNLKKSFIWHISTVWKRYIFSFDICSREMCNRRKWKFFAKHVMTQLSNFSCQMFKKITELANLKFCDSLSIKYSSISVLLTLLVIKILSKIRDYLHKNLDYCSVIIPYSQSFPTLFN